MATIGRSDEQMQANTSISAHQYLSSSVSSSSSRRRQPPSRYLVTVIPPEALPHDPPHPRTSPLRGTLVPLYPTLSGQVAAIAREYGLPSTGGIVVYLLETISSANGPLASLIGEGGPRIGEDAWELLWAQLFLEDMLELEREEALLFAVDDHPLASSGRVPPVPQIPVHLAGDISVEDTQDDSTESAELEPPPNIGRTTTPSGSPIRPGKALRAVEDKRPIWTLPNGSYPHDVTDARASAIASPSASISLQSRPGSVASRGRPRTAPSAGSANTSHQSSQPSPRILRESRMARQSFAGQSMSFDRRSYASNAKGSSFAQPVIVGKIEFEIDERRGGGKWFEAWSKAASPSSTTSPAPISSIFAPRHSSLQATTPLSFGQVQTNPAVPMPAELEQVTMRASGLTAAQREAEGGYQQLDDSSEADSSQERDDAASAETTEMGTRATSLQPSVASPLAIQRDWIAPIARLDDTEDLAPLLKRGLGIYSDQIPQTFVPAAASMPQMSPALSDEVRAPDDIQDVQRLLSEQRQGPRLSSPILLASACPDEQHEADTQISPETDGQGSAGGRVSLRVPGVEGADAAELPKTSRSSSIDMEASFDNLERILGTMSPSAARQRATSEHATGAIIGASDGYKIAAEPLRANAPSPARSSASPALIERALQHVPEIRQSEWHERRASDLMSPSGTVIPNDDGLSPQNILVRGGTDLRHASMVSTDSAQTTLGYMRSFSPPAVEVPPLPSQSSIESSAGKPMSNRNASLFAFKAVNPAASTAGGDVDGRDANEPSWSALSSEPVTAGAADSAASAVARPPRSSSSVANASLSQSTIEAPGTAAEAPPLPDLDPAMLIERKVVAAPITAEEQPTDAISPITTAQDAHEPMQDLDNSAEMPSEMTKSPSAASGFFQKPAFKFWNKQELASEGESSRTSFKIGKSFKKPRSSKSPSRKQPSASRSPGLDNHSTGDASLPPLSPSLSASASPVLGFGSGSGPMQATLSDSTSQKDGQSSDVSSPHLPLTIAALAAQAAAVEAQGAPPPRKQSSQANSHFISRFPDSPTSNSARQMPSAAISMPSTPPSVRGSSVAPGSARSAASARPPFSDNTGRDLSALIAEESSFGHDATSAIVPPVRSNASLPSSPRLASLQSPGSTTNKTAHSVKSSVQPLADRSNRSMDEMVKRQSLDDTSSSRYDSDDLLSSYGP
ncbi:uncharacterized protein L969DRAFT_14113 [Mixia osmundae IAM 14324]|uniref:uncharacterized protein n=1 Tax=Mixia osmundae (strain CBS 9802 / IAM 14324 / JCM 22182 / KY 12970) TaxID=764103 RepID=UPI0004A55799|nr:uncharacterized protein L969DRAFT_14113 [Mixia osmundae IAM 14324]KEI41902.1 hypothetical protein L969DRAFT_14113 [Mixia osmundae IAM 14324]